MEEDSVKEAPGCNTDRKYVKVRSKNAGLLKESIDYVETHGWNIFSSTILQVLVVAVLSFLVLFNSSLHKNVYAINLLYLESSTSWETCR